MPEEPEARGDDESGEDEAGPKVEFSEALGEAGHEAEELGYADVEDSGTVLQQAGDRDPDVEHEAARDFADEFPGD